MPNYRRLISYIYAYEGGVKGKNIGFAKIESRGVQCKITVNVKKVYVGSNDTGVYLLSGDQEIFLGNIFIRGGSGEFRTVVSMSDVEHSGISMEDCFGLTVHDVENTWRSYTTIWEDAVAHAAEVELADAVSTAASDDKKENVIPMEKIREAVRQIAEEFPVKPVDEEKPAYIPAVEFSSELTPDWAAVPKEEAVLEPDLAETTEHESVIEEESIQEPNNRPVPISEPVEEQSGNQEISPEVTSEALHEGLEDWETRNTVCYRADSQVPDSLWQMEAPENNWEAALTEPINRSMEFDPGFKYRSIESEFQWAAEPDSRGMDAVPDPMEWSANASPDPGEWSADASPNPGGWPANASPNPGEWSANASPNPGEWSANASPDPGEWSADVSPNPGEWSANVSPNPGDWSANVSPNPGDWSANASPNPGDWSANAPWNYEEWSANVSPNPEEWSENASWNRKEWSANAVPDPMEWNVNSVAEPGYEESGALENNQNWAYTGNPDRTDMERSRENYLGRPVENHMGSPDGYTMGGSAGSAMGSSTRNAMEGPSGNPMGGPAGNEMGNSYGNEMGSPSRNAMGNSAGNMMGSPTGNEMGNSYGNEMGSPAGNEMGSPAGNMMGNPVGNMMGNPAGNMMGSPTGNMMGSPAGNEMGSPAGNMMGNPAGNMMGSPAGNEMGNPAGNMMGSPAGNEMGSPAGNMMGSPAGNQMGSPTGNAMGNSAGNESGSPAGEDYMGNPTGAVMEPPAENIGENPAENVEGSSEWIWEKLKKEHTKITDFDYENGCEILTIKPQDIGLLPRENWTFGNNSFLLHGYYNYRYLIIARLNNPDGMPRFLLGVPGHYYDNERYMAAMFGFPNFVLSKNQPMQDGRFGYWYTDITLETQGEEENQ